MTSPDLEAAAVGEEHVEDPSADGKVHEGYVASVLRALSLLEAFGVEEKHLSLAELARRIKLPRTTTLRLAKTLEVGEYLVQMENGRWRLGPSTARLSGRYLAAFDLHHVIEPILIDLSRATGESASFFVHDGNNRIRMLRVHGTTHKTAKPNIGEALPLEKGSPGRVILAYLGKPGAPYEDIRAKGYCCTSGEARAASASVAAPVFGNAWTVIGALCINGHADRLTFSVLEHHAPAVVTAARAATAALAATRDRPLPVVDHFPRWFQ